MLLWDSPCRKLPVSTSDAVCGSGCLSGRSRCKAARRCDTVFGDMNWPRAATDTETGMLLFAGSLPNVHTSIPSRVPIVGVWAAGKRVRLCVSLRDCTAREVLTGCVFSVAPPSDVRRLGTVTCLISNIQLQVEVSADQVLQALFRAEGAGH